MTPNFKLSFWQREAAGRLPTVPPPDNSSVMLADPPGAGEPFEMRWGTGGGGSGGTPIDWATSQEIVDGTVARKSTDPAGLWGAGLQQPTSNPVNDARAFVRLKGTGKIDSGFLEFVLGPFGGSLDATQPYNPPPPSASTDNGTYFVQTVSGTVDGSWNIANNPGTVAAGDMLFYDKPNDQFFWVDSLPATAYVLKAGDTFGASAFFEWPGASGSETGNALMDFKGGALQDCDVSGGQF